MEKHSLKVKGHALVVGSDLPLQSYGEKERKVLSFSGKLPGFG